MPYADLQARKEFMRRYYEQHKDKLKARARMYAAKAKEVDPDGVREKRSKWEAIYRKEQQPWVKYRKRSPLKYLYRLAARRAKERGLVFDIQLSDLSLPDTCPLLGIRIDSFDPVLDFHPSIDRIDSTKGYVKGNVWIISHRANRIKNNATADELMIIALALKEKILGQ